MNRRLRRLAAIGAVVIVLWALSRAGVVLVVEVAVAEPGAIVSLASHEWERLPRTAELARLHRSALIVLTQPRSVTIHNCHRCEFRTDDLIALGVERQRIHLVPIKAGGTFGEARAVREFVQQRGVRQVLVVTSPYHTRRSLAVFRAALDDLGVVVGMASASATSPARPSRWWLARYDLAYVSYEWAAMGYYAVRYGVWPSA